MPDELTKALLLEEVALPSAIAEALYVSLTSAMPFVQALTDVGAVKADVLVRYLGRTDAPFLRQVVAVAELVDRLPPGLCARLAAVPVRRDAITGTVDVVVADATDPHAGREIAFHLQAPVRIVRAPLSTIEDALRRLRTKPSIRPRIDEILFDSRPDARVSDVPGPNIQRHVVPSLAPITRGRRNTPTWGTPVHNATPAEPSEPPPRSGYGSEIPIPLTRRTFAVERGGTQPPPPLRHPAEDALGEGYAVDPASFQPVVEVSSAPPHREPEPGYEPQMPSFIPGPPPVPGGGGVYAAFAPQMPFAEIGGILAALRSAGSRDEVLELVLTGARTMAFKVALFVVKRGGYLGWACTPEFGDRGALQSVLVPLDVPSVFDEAVRDGLYLGPIRHDEAHAALLHVMRSATRDVAVVPIRVSGKTAVVLVADELGDTMLATRRLEELARAAGEAFARIVRMRR